MWSKKIDIDGRLIGEGFPTYIVAEAGIAHDGNLDNAKQLALHAKDAGCDAVKFQMYNTDAFIDVKSLAYWHERYKKKELKPHEFFELYEYCKTIGITCFFTPHDEPSLEELKELDPPIIKIGSGELGNWDFIRKIAVLRKPTFVSVGMYRTDEIEGLLNTFFGPKLDDNEFDSPNNPNLVLLHCVTRYPTPNNDARVERMVRLREIFNILTGYSDHVTGNDAGIDAVSLEAAVVEKHIALPGVADDGQDYKVSCVGLVALKLFVSTLRGWDTWWHDDEEMKNKAWACKTEIDGKMMRGRK